MKITWLGPIEEIEEAEATRWRGVLVPLGEAEPPNLCGPWFYGRTEKELLRTMAAAARCRKENLERALFFYELVYGTEASGEEACSCPLGPRLPEEKKAVEGPSFPWFLREEDRLAVVRGWLGGCNYVFYVGCLGERLVKEAPVVSIHLDDMRFIVPILVHNYPAFDEYDLENPMSTRTVGRMLEDVLGIIGWLEKGVVDPYVAYYMEDISLASFVGVQWPEDWPEGWPEEGFPSKEVLIAFLKDFRGFLFEAFSHMGGGGVYFNVSGI